MKIKICPRCRINFSDPSSYIVFLKDNEYWFQCNKCAWRKKV